MGLKRLSIILIFLALFFVFPAKANAATVSDISKQLICQCGCTMVLLNCSHAECGSREAMTVFINDQLAKGQSDEQIIQLFVAQYGEQVLSSPPKRGFNLMAWFTPFIALLVGAAVIYIALKKWVRREAPSQTYAPAKLDEKDEEYRHQVEKELKEFAERSFR
jgi:cytochrome c-type biogenesis protein CcmH